MTCFQQIALKKPFKLVAHFFGALLVVTLTTLPSFGRSSAGSPGVPGEPSCGTMGCGRAPTAREILTTVLGSDAVDAKIGINDISSITKSFGAAGWVYRIEVPYFPPGRFPTTCLVDAQIDFFPMATTVDGVQAVKVGSSDAYAIVSIAATGTCP